MSTKCTTPDCTEAASHQVQIGDQKFPACDSCSDFMKEHTDCPVTPDDIDF